MELEIALGRRRLIGMEEQDRVSQASSIATISSLTTRERGNEKLQAFGKRCRAVKRNPNCPVVIRGWLCKRDSSGLKLWKRRWFVLSDYCLFYYKDSREECVLGSIPLPSYRIIFCSPQECRNRKFAFKVVHQGMRAYLLSADTQEDMLGWVRALSQSACMENDVIIPRRCASYQDFTQMGGSAESVNLPPGDATSLSAAHLYRPGGEESHEGVRVHLRHERDRARRSDAACGRSLSLERAVEDVSFPYPQSQSSCPTSPKAHYGSRPHTPVGRVDMRPPNLRSISPLLPSAHSAGPERWPSQAYSSSYSTLRRGAGKLSHVDQLPPLPPSRVTHNPQSPPHAHLLHGHGHSVYEKEAQPLTTLQEETDLLLTRLCGCDKLLHTLSLELDHLQTDKERVQFALEMTRLQLDEQQLDEQEVSQKTLLQDELIVIRARLCDVSLEMERVWEDYERMESELCVFRSHLQHICHFGLPQERSQAQRQLWMMEDVLSGLRANRSRFRAMLGLQRPAVLPVALQNSAPMHPLDTLHYSGEEPQPPVRPPPPHELQRTNHNSDPRAIWAEQCHKVMYSNTAQDSVEHKTSSMHTDTDPAATGVRLKCNAGVQRRVLSEEEEEEDGWSRGRGQEKMSSKRRWVEHQQVEEGVGSPGPSPLRVMRVVTGVLPSALTPRRVSVQDPPSELTTPTTTQSNAQHTHLQQGAERAEEEVESSTPANNVDCLKLNCEYGPRVSSERRDAKLRRVERIRERVMRSVGRGGALEAAHPNSAGQASERWDSDSSNHHHNAVHNSGIRSFKPRPAKEACQRDEIRLQLSDMKDSNPPSTNHTSAVDINSKPTMQRRSLATLKANCSASTNQRAEWFLSTHQWQDFIPLNIQDDDPALIPAANQSSCNKNVSEGESNDSRGWRQSSSSVVSDGGQKSASVSSQPAGTSPDSHVTFPSNQQETDLRIYEEIRYEEIRYKDDTPNPDTKAGVNAVGMPETQQSNLPTNHNTGAATSTNRHVTLGNGGGNGDETTEDQMAELGGGETGSDVIDSKTGQPIYSCVTKNSASNHSTACLKPRVTVVSTSL